jgi:hypothetical protein
MIFVDVNLQHNVRNIYIIEMGISRRCMSPDIDRNHDMNGVNETNRFLMPHNSDNPDMIDGHFIGFLLGPTAQFDCKSDGQFGEF